MVILLSVLSELLPQQVFFYFCNHAIYSSSGLVPVHSKKTLGQEWDAFSSAWCFPLQLVSISSLLVQGGATVPSICLKNGSFKSERVGLRHQPNQDGWRRSGMWRSTTGQVPAWLSHLTLVKSHLQVRSFFFFLNIVYNFLVKSLLFYSSHPKIR